MSEKDKTAKGDAYIRSLLNSTGSDLVVQRQNGAGKWIDDHSISAGTRSGSYSAAKLWQYRFVTQKNEPVYIRLTPLQHEKGGSDHIDGEIGHPQGDG